MRIAVLLCVVAGPAFAGDFDTNCVPPGAVPEEIYFTVTSVGDIAYGDLSESVCAKITKKGVKLCKAQVKAAAKCMEKEAETVRSIAVKQCKQLDDPSDRVLCKTFFENGEDELEDVIELDREDGLAECDTDFAEGLTSVCMLGPVPS